MRAGGGMSRVSRPEDHDLLAHIQRLDDAWLRLMVSGRRAYLGAHWLSDAIAGVLLGTSCALLAALVVGWLQRRWGAPRRRPAAPPPVPDTARPAGRL